MAPRCVGDLDRTGRKGFRAHGRGMIAVRAGLAYSDAGGRIYFDESSAPLAAGGAVRPPRDDELIPAPLGTVPTMLPGRVPLVETAEGKAERRTALAALLPAGHTPLRVAAYRERAGAA